MLNFPPISPPPNVSKNPDEDTKKALTDFTSASAHNRVFYINLGFFKYGTNDLGHAAAILFSLLLFSLAAAIMLAGIWIDEKNVSWTWMEKIFNWVSSAFLFTVGFAIGGGKKGSNKINSANDSTSLKD